MAKTHVVVMAHGGESQRCLRRAGEWWAVSDGDLYYYDNQQGHMVRVRDGLTSQTIRRRITDCIRAKCTW